jgi:asparagine synthase (glutamine-hydrolysing)
LATPGKLQTSDTQVLFNRLRTDGLGILPKLNGAFSFCISDSNATYLVRDRFGEKPLYYTIKAGTLFFASEIKALATQTSLKLRLPKLYTQLETPVGIDTVFEGVFQVEPGTYIRIDRTTGTLSTHRYHEFQTAHHAGSLNDQVHELRRLLDDAINIRTPRGLDYGAYISGGLDSSIVSLASGPRAVLTYVPGSSLVPSEERYADIVAKGIPGAKYTKVGPSTNVLQDLVASVYANDGPTTTSAAYSQFLLSREARHQGLRVMLAGDGADEFFIGYARQMLAYLPEAALSDDLRHQYGPLAARGLRFGKTTRSGVYANMLNRVEKESSDLNARLTDIFDHYEDPLQAMSVAEAKTSLPPLLSTSDHLNMAFGIEIRNPFLDYRVVDFAMSLRPDAKLQSGKGVVTSKYALRQAFSDIVPEEITSRRDKVGFSSQILDLISNEWQPYVQNSRAILTEAYPDEPYFASMQDASHKYSRVDYQIMQLAITHLLYCEKVSVDETVSRLVTPTRVAVG